MRAVGLAAALVSLVVTGAALVAVTLLPERDWRTYAILAALSGALASTITMALGVWRAR